MRSLLLFAILLSTEAFRTAPNNLPHFRTASSLEMKKTPPAGEESRLGATPGISNDAQSVLAIAIGTLGLGGAVVIFGALSNGALLVDEVRKSIASASEGRRQIPCKCPSISEDWCHSRVNSLAYLRTGVTDSAPTRPLDPVAG